MELQGKNTKYQDILNIINFKVKRRDWPGWVDDPRVKNFKMKILIFFNIKKTFTSQTYSLKYY